MAKRTPGYGQWRNLYEKAMAKPEFKVGVLTRTRENLMNVHGSITMQAAQVEERIAELDAEIAALSGGGSEPLG